MKKFSGIAIFVTLAICLVFTFQNRWKGPNGDSWKNVISSDGFGYYAFLPCIFIYHGFDYDKLVKEERKIMGSGAYCTTAIVYQNKIINKCFPGVAILLAPFFLLAYLLSHILGYDTGGYGFLFQASVSIGALFYLLVGLIFIRKLLKEFNISEYITGLTIILIVFGTNLFYYATIEPAMGHVYSFGLMAVFLYFTKRAIGNPGWKNLVCMMASLSILTIIRPTNLLGAFFIPFLAGSPKETTVFIRNIFGDKKIAALIFIAAAILFMQFLLCYLQTGHFFVYSYPGESFDFGHPHFADILFSYRKGWFVYTPLMFVIVTGSLIVLLIKDRFRFLCALFFFLLITYVLSSWWSWWYGGGYSIRAFIDFYPAFALLLALMLNSIKSNWVKMALALVTFLCVCVSLIQTSQYINSIITNDGMNKNIYWKIFLKNDETYRYVFDYPDTSGFKPINNYFYSNDFEHNTWGHDENITASYAHHGTYSAFSNETHPYTPILSLKASALPSIRPLYVFVKLWAYMPDFDNNAVLVVAVSPEKGNSYYWSSKSLQGFVFEPKVWSLAYTLQGLPAFKNPCDNVSIFVLTPKGIVYIDDMEVSFGTE